MLCGDDCKTVNPLGSKAGIHKLGLLYFAVKSLPSDLISNLRSLFLLAVYKSDDAKTYGIHAILHPIVEELKSLEEEGIVFDTAVFKDVIKFTIVQVLGDNLGLNALLGYTESFSGNYVCRTGGVKFTKTAKEFKQTSSQHSYALLTHTEQIWC